LQRLLFRVWIGQRAAFGTGCQRDVFCRHELYSPEVKLWSFTTEITIPYSPWLRPKVADRFERSWNLDCHHVRSAPSVKGLTP
jgi:hypothetical protein